jgi:hypothetical protein
MRKPIPHRTTNLHDSKSRYHSSMFSLDSPASYYYSEKSDCKKHPDCECIPRKGELVKNGGFENPHKSFTNWSINPGVDVIDPGMGNFPHQGHTAARLGFIEPLAILYQIVPGICPGGLYQLVFFMGTAKDRCNAPVNVRLDFLDRHRHQLGSPALDILIPQNSLFESYTAFINNTVWPSPPRTRFIRVSFETDTGADADDYVTLDDVALVALEGTSHI